MQNTFMFAMEIPLALLTGLIGVILGAALNHFLTRDREKQSSVQFQRRAVIAIRAELESIIEINKQGITGLLRSVPEGNFLRTKMEITQDYFTVFNSNCSQLGRIDENLSSNLVEAYIGMKAMVDAYRIHNNLLQMFWDDPKCKTDAFIAYLVGSTNRLKEMDKKTTEVIEVTFTRMDKLGYKK